MRKTIFAGLALLLPAITLQSAAQKDDVMTRQNGTYIVNTTTLASDVQGYVGPTPVKIYIKKNKVERVEFLKNQETPKYMARVKKALLNKWDGLKTKDAASQQVDGVTGATFTSEAIIKNVQRGLEYYHKKK